MHSLQFPVLFASLWGTKIAFATLPLCAICFERSWFRKRLNPREGTARVRATKRRSAKQSSWSSFEAASIGSHILPYERGKRTRKENEWNKSRKEGVEFNLAKGVASWASTERPNSGLRWRSGEWHSQHRNTSMFDEYRWHKRRQTDDGIFLPKVKGSVRREITEQYAISI